MPNPDFSFSLKVYLVVLSKYGQKLGKVVVLTMLLLVIETFLSFITFS